MPALDLIVTLDDATSEIYSAFLVEEEGTTSSFRARAEVIARARPAMRALHRPGEPRFPLRPRRARRSPRSSRPRSAARSRSSASSPSRPTRRRRAAAPSAPSARCRTACPRSSRAPASPRSRRPAASSRRSVCPSTTRASRSRPSSPRRRSWPTRPAPIATSSACRRSAWSATTTACATTVSPCRSRRARCEPHFVKATGARARRPGRHARALPRAAAPGPLPGRRHAARRRPHAGRLIPLDGQPCGSVDKPPACPPAPQASTSAVNPWATNTGQLSVLLTDAGPRHAGREIKLSRKEFTLLRLPAARPHPDPSCGLQLAESAPGDLIGNE